VTGTEPRFEVEKRRVRIPAGDGESLAANLFLPVGAGPVPALVSVLPYRTDLSDGSDLAWFAARGHASLLVDLRGTGASDGAHRPPFDPHEADDGVAVIEWAAEQPWCTGDVGMWGHSYGALMTLRTASRRPPHLRAIMPVMGMLDPERDFVHPDGAKGCLGSLVSWGLGTLLFQLLPPFEDHTSAQEQRRWRARLDVDPWLLDLCRHGPGHPVWRERVVDASLIQAPALFIAGWRDLFCEGTIRAYEQTTAPKKLLAGPWMHTLPHASPFDAIDFNPIALRWWDHWLLGIDDGVMDEPSVTTYVQGAPSPWRTFDVWPPTKEEHRLVATSSTRLEAGEGEPAILAELRSDPTLGALSGLTGLPTSGIGLPLDQHAEDVRTISMSSDPLPIALPIAGRPVVTVRLAPGGAAERLVVRLTSVDADGRSLLITSGVRTDLTGEGPHEIGLTPTCFDVAAGHRLRIVLGDADFPRLWPAGDAMVQLVGVTVCLPVLTDDAGTVVDLGTPQLPSGPVPVAFRAEPRWTITEDLVRDGIEVLVGETLQALTPNRAHLIELSTDKSAAVTTGAPEAAVVHATGSTVARMGTGEVIDVRVELRMTADSLTAHGNITVDGMSLFSRSWSS
jgi:putative CocE/NonD family hydrolase